MGDTRWGAPSDRVSARIAALIRADRGIAGLGVNLEPLPFHGEIDGRDFILGLDRLGGHLVNGVDELGHGGPPVDERNEEYHRIT
jgi:hypothetical protein